MITDSEVRAVVLSKLNIGPGVLWDLGAGSGSVAVEATGLCDNLQAYAVEKKKERVENIRTNSEVSSGNVQTLNDDILAVIDGMPAPRSIFIGGGGREVGNILEASYRRLLPGGRVVAAAVMLETKTQLESALPAQRTEIVEVAIRHAQNIGPGSRMVPDNPVTLYCFQKEE